MKLFVPIAMFAAALAGLEWAGTGRLSTLALRTVAAAAISVWITRNIPWTRLIPFAPIPSRRFNVLLFFMMLVHFVSVIGGECRRTFLSRRMCTPHRFGTGWFPSLRWALVAVVERSLRRAERFYAAQLLKGL